MITPVFVDGALFGFCGSIAHKSDIGGPVPGSCSGQAREIFNEGLHLPAGALPARLPARTATSSASSPPTAARPSSCSATSAASSAPTGSASSGSIELVAQVRQGEDPRLLRPAARALGSNACARPSRNGRTAASRPSASSTTTASTWKSRCASTSSSRRRATRIHFDFSGSADQTKGPANIRPPLVAGGLRLRADLADRPADVRVPAGCCAPSPSPRARAACSIRASRRR